MRDDDGGVFRETTRAQTHHLSIIPNILVGWAKKLTRNGDPYPFYDDGAIREGRHLSFKHAKNCMAEWHAVASLLGSWYYPS